MGPHTVIDLDNVRRAVVARRSHLRQTALLLCGLLLATAVRWFTDRGLLGVPFATFLPVIVLASVFLEWQYALASAVLSAAIARLLFGAITPADGWQAIVLLVAYLATAGFLAFTGHVLRLTIQDLDRQTRQFRTFNAELQHRAKNALQIVRALAARASKATDPISFYESMAGRLDLMVKANELLGVGISRECGMGELATLATEPFPPGAISCRGPDALVAEEACMPLVMALHELGTNALKYGALSVDTGCVTLEWRVAGDEIDILWRETGGPPVVRPTRRGLGSRLLSAQSALRSVDLQFLTEGVTCRIVVPRAA